ncbi:phage tail assembly protein [Amaricoccus sp. HAR-UPW-R2A-40]|nr:phage tail assembly protein [Amaricoccus sp. HAR-UPW-R2A-40]
MTSLSAPVTLSTPIVRTGAAEPFAAVAIRKPTAGALRGLMLTKVITMDVSTMLTLLPRVTEPALLPDETAALDPADLLALSTAVVGFFMTPAQAAEVEAAQASL